MTIAHNQSLEITTEWTLETWIKPDTITNTYKALISKNRLPRPPSLWVLGDKIEVWFETESAGDTYQASGHNILKPGKWQHIAATYDGSFIKIFVNGKLDTMVANNLEPRLNTADWTLGQRGDNLFWFGGYMDETRIWNRALSQDEIQQKMFNTHAADVGLLAAWSFNQIAVNEFETVVDNSGNKNDGTVGGQNLVDSDTPVSNVFVTALEPIGNIIRLTEFLLEQNYPNPFNPSTTIPFRLKKQGKVSLKIYDTVGRKVLDVFNETVGAGSYSFTVDMSVLPSGTYFYQLKTSNFVQTKRMLLIK
jgi:Concanavalin A-like lectin/glucanases superfamily/Secretion system C-terminal sorting domain